jgi:hypothetical protein
MSEGPSLPSFVGLGVAFSSGSLVVLAGLSFIAAVMAKCDKQTARGKKLQISLMALVVGGIGIGGWYGKDYLLNGEGSGIFGGMPTSIPGADGAHPELAMWRQYRNTFLLGFALLICVSIALLETYVIVPLNTYCPRVDADGRQVEATGILGAVLQTRRLIYYILAGAAIIPAGWASINVYQHKQVAEADLPNEQKTGLLSAAARGMYSLYTKTSHAKHRADFSRGVEALPPERGGFVPDGTGSTALAQNNFQLAKLLGYEAEADWGDDFNGDFGDFDGLGNGAGDLDFNQG